MKHKVLLLIFFVTAFSACKKEIRQKNFPSEITNGANTFGCYIGKMQFLPCKTTGGISPIKLLQASGYYYDIKHVGVVISAINDCDGDYTLGRSVIIEFDSVEIAVNTTYKLGNYFDTTRHKVSCMYSEDLVDFGSDSSLEGTLTVTYFDNINKILSGKFETKLKNREGTQTLDLTGGLFDVKF